MPLPFSNSYSVSLKFKAFPLFGNVRLFRKEKKKEAEHLPFFLFKTKQPPKEAYQSRIQRILTTNLRVRLNPNLRKPELLKQ